MLRRISREEELRSANIATAPAPNRRFRPRDQIIYGPENPWRSANRQPDGSARISNYASLAYACASKAMRPSITGPSTRFDRLSALNRSSISGSIPARKRTGPRVTLFCNRQKPWRMRGNDRAEYRDTWRRLWCNLNSICDSKYKSFFHTGHSCLPESM